MTATPVCARPSAPGSAEVVRVDVVIVGGGAAGLWLANVLQARGYAFVLLESGDLGGAQTLASQGMIHGGIKYALSGNLTGASEAIAAMPDRWRRCLHGQGEVDLSALTPLADHYHLFAAGSTLGRLTTFFASRAMRGRIRRLERSQFPAALAHPGFQGVVYALNDFVLDSRELLSVLHDAVAGQTYRHRVRADSLAAANEGVLLNAGPHRLLARRLVITAGAGAQSLLDALGVESPRMQLRPLQQVMVRHRYPHPLFAHCLTGIRRAEPRMTITSHAGSKGGSKGGSEAGSDPGEWLWYLGGQLATDGADMSETDLISHARAELEVCLPWIDWRDAELTTLRIDRAEPAQDGGRRPDQAYAAACGHCIVAWPTKLSLIPDLGDRVLSLLPPPGDARAPVLDLPPASVGHLPWHGDAGS